MTTNAPRPEFAPLCVAGSDRPLSRLLRPALFLDRDGVVNTDHGYVHHPNDVTFVPGLFPLCRSARMRGFALVIVTNQSGIGRGYFGMKDFLRLSHWMLNAFAEQSAPVAAIYACPHVPQDGCDCRKPKPGMFLTAAADLALDMTSSVVVGDSLRDIEAASAAKVDRGFLLGSIACPNLLAVEKALLGAGIQDDG